MEDAHTDTHTQYLVFVFCSLNHKKIFHCLLNIWNTSRYRDTLSIQFSDIPTGHSVPGV